MALGRKMGFGDYLLLLQIRANVDHWVFNEIMFGLEAALQRTPLPHGGRDRGGGGGGLGSIAASAGPRKGLTMNGNNYSAFDHFPGMFE